MNNTMLFQLNPIPAAPQSLFQRNLKPISASVAIAMLVAIAGIFTALVSIIANFFFGAAEPSLLLMIFITALTTISFAATWGAVALYHWAVQNWRD